MVKRFISFITITLLIFTALPSISTTTSAAELYTEVQYYLKNWTGNAVTVSGYDNGANVTMSTFTGDDSQIFEFEIASEGGIRIKNVRSGRYLEVRNGELNDMAVVGLWQNNGQSCARWGLSANGNGTFTFTNCCSGLNMNVAGNSSDNNTQIWQYHADGTGAEQFTAVPVSEATGSGQSFFVNTQAGLYLRNGAGQNYSIICAMPYRSVVTAYKANSGWFYVNYNGTYGWCNGQYLTTTGYSSSNGNTSSGTHGDPNDPTVFSQADDDWADVPYTCAARPNATISSSGCGLLAMTNATYYLTGKFIAPEDLANYSMRNGYRVSDGTAWGLYESFCDDYGSYYGITYNGSSTSFNSLRSHLCDGEVAVVTAYNHIMAVVDYDDYTGEYLILDSYRSSNRKTYPDGYVWLTQSEIQSNRKLDFGHFFFIARR